MIDPAGQAIDRGLGVTVVNQYGDHPITRGFGGGYTVYPLAMPLEMTEVSGVEGMILIYSSDRTTAQRINSRNEVQSDPATDPKGPFNLGMALTRDASSDLVLAPAPSPSPSASSSPSPSPSPTPSSSPNATAKPQSRLVVIGNSSFATDGRFDQQLNGDLFLNATTWLSQRDSEVLSIRPKELTSRRIVLSPGQQLSITLISMAFLPLIGFSTAAAVWWRADKYH